MFPILFQSGSLVIHSYGFFIALGYLATVTACSYLSVRADLLAINFVSICFYALIFGLVGARMLFVATQWEYFKTHQDEVWQLWRGGMVFYGAFLSGLAAVLVFIFFKKMPLLRTLDILAVALPLGQAIGRIGCFAAGCCHGSLCDLPWAVHIDSDLVDPILRGKPIHPVQLYESVGLFVLSAFLFFLWKKNYRAGLTSLVYCLAYACLRFYLEFYRGDSIRGFWWNSGLSTSQGIALIIAAASLLLLLRQIFRGRCHTAV